MRDYLYNPTKDGGEFFSSSGHIPQLKRMQASLREDAQRMLNDIIAGIDNYLFNLADNSTSLDDQNQHLALMHQFHIQKKELVESGIERLLDAFNKCYAGDAYQVWQGSANQYAFQWSFDSKEQFELEKIVKTLWQKLHSENTGYLKHINQMLNSLYSTKLDELNFALSALTVSHLVADTALMPCQSNIQRKWVLRALNSETAVFSHFYAQQNKRIQTQNSNSQALRSQGANTGMKYKTYRRHQNVDQINQNMLVQGHPISVSGLQQQAHALSEEMNDVLGELQTKLHLPGSKLEGQALMQVIEGRLGSELSDYERQSIILVERIFARFVAEKSLPLAVRKLLKKLEILCVKLTLSQSAVFNENSHPIRKLIDLIAESSAVMQRSHGEPVGNDPVFRAVEDAVQKLCISYTDDESLINEIYAALKYKITSHIHGNKKHYEKTMEQEKALTESLKRKLHTQSVPPLVSKFVRNIWYKVLKQTNTADTHAYEGLQHILDDLIWSVQPKHLEQEKSLLLNMIPGLVAKIRSALSNTYISEDKCEKFLSELEHIHVSALQGRQEWNGNEELPDDYSSGLSSMHLDEGAWVKFVHNQHAYFLRLDWYNDFSHEYSFVDSAYKKVVTLNQEELAKCVNLGELELDAEASLFNRVLRTVA